MKIIPVLLTFFFILSCWSNEAISQEIKSPNTFAVAEVGDRVILDDEFQRILIQYRKSGDMKKIVNTLTADGKEAILNELVDNKLFAIEALNQGIDNDPQVKQTIQNAIDDVLAESLLKWEISRLDLSNAGLMTFYNKNAESFITRIRVKARHINTRSKEEAEATMKEIRNGRDFAEVATERNIDSSKSKGGDLGWVVKGTMVKPFEEALFSLKEGQLSGIIKTSFGFHIIKVEKIDKGKPKPFETVKDEIKKRIIGKHISQLKNELRKKYPVHINRELLQAAEK
jgi:peptidyl-prolyl cis-trans isomerase C